MIAPVARSLRWWTSAQLEALGGALASPWREWLSAWYGEPPEGVLCVLAHDVRAEANWHTLAASGEARAWTDMPVLDGGSVPTALFGGLAPVAPDSLAAATERASRKALAAVLARVLALQEPPQPDDEAPAPALPWSGDVIATLSAPSLVLRVRMNGDCAALALGLGSSPELAAGLRPVDAAVPFVRTGVSVELAGGDISLGALQAMAVGDVVRLPHALSDPLLVKVADVAVCGAYLGRRAHSRAVELLKIPSP